MADWEAESYEVDLLVGTAVVRDKWEGEDEEEEDVKDNWDDEQEDEEDDEDETAEIAQTIREAAKVSEKRQLSDKTKESKTTKKEEETSQARPADLTAEGQLAERLRAQKLQEEADLELTREAFGVCASEPCAATGIDAMCPSSRDDFAEFERLLKEKLARLESSEHYPGFLDSLFRELCISLDVEDLRKISNSLVALLSERQKLEKQNKGKGKKKKGAIAGGGLKAKRWEDMDRCDAGDGYGQDFEDFM